MDYNYSDQQNNQQENPVNNTNDPISADDGNVLAKFKELYSMLCQHFQKNNKQLKALKAENNQLKENLKELQEENDDLYKDMEYLKKQISLKESEVQPYDLMKLILPDLTKIKSVVAEAQNLETLKKDILKLYQSLFSSFDAAGITLSESAIGSRINPGDKISIGCDVPTGDFSLDGRIASCDRFGCTIQGDHRALEEKVKIYRYASASQPVRLGDYSNDFDKASNESAPQPPMPEQQKKVEINIVSNEPDPKPEKKEEGFVPIIRHGEEKKSVKHFESCDCDESVVLEDDEIKYGSSIDDMIQLCFDSEKHNLFLTNIYYQPNYTIKFVSLDPDKKYMISYKNKGVFYYSGAELNDCKCRLVRKENDIYLRLIQEKKTIDSKIHTMR